MDGPGFELIKTTTRELLSPFTGWLRQGCMISGVDVFVVFVCHPVGIEKRHDVIH